MPPLAKSSFADDAAYVSLASLRDLCGDRAVTNRLLVTTAADVDVQAVVGELDAARLAHGGDAESFHDLLVTNLWAQTSSMAFPAATFVTTMPTIRVRCRAGPGSELHPTSRGCTTCSGCAVGERQSASVAGWLGPSVAAPLGR